MLQLAAPEVDPSPDGIHRHDRHHLEPVVERANDGAFNVTWDHRDRVYRAYSIQRDASFAGRRPTPGDSRRIICYTESPALESPWKESVPILDPTSRDDAVAVGRYGARLYSYRWN